MSLEEKLNTIKKLSKEIVKKKGKSITRTINQEIENEQYKLEFALKNLLDEMQNKEADVKIVAMQKIVDLLKDV